MKYSCFSRLLASASTIISISASLVVGSPPASATHTEVNGCSAPWAGYLRNSPAGADFEPACNNHDICYGDTTQSKGICDQNFYDSMRAACEKQFLRKTGGILSTVLTGGQALTTCYGWAKNYRTAVALAPKAQRGFDDAQAHARSEKQQQQESASSNTIAFKNNCFRPIRVAIHFKNLQNQWETKAWYSFVSGESARLTGVDTKNRNLYYYAETTDDSKIVWKGNDTSQTVGGRVYNMLKIDTGSDIVNWTQTLNCK